MKWKKNGKGKGRNDDLKLFWLSWKKRYLREIRQKENSYKRCNLKNHDVILVGNEKPRNEWPLGIIKSLIYGKDGKIRSVEVLYKGKSKIRPIQNIYRLEEHDS